MGAQTGAETLLLAAVASGEPVGQALERIERTFGSSVARQVAHEIPELGRGSAPDVVKIEIAARRRSWAPFTRPGLVALAAWGACEITLTALALIVPGTSEIRLLGW